MDEMTRQVSHQQLRQLFHNKFIAVLGDSIQRAVYKDLVLLLQKEKYLSSTQLRSKGEMSFEQDCLVEGGCLSQMHNGTHYREVRQFQSAHHLVRFYFVTRIYSSYMRGILNDFRRGLKPDVVIVNSCVWDISRYNSSWIDNYKENLHWFFEELSEIVPEETLVIWNLTMPLAERIRGGFLVPEIEQRASRLRQDVIEANFYSGTLADAYEMDVLDLHFHFRLSLQHRAKDGVHWNALAHRKITSLLSQHAAQAWGVIMPSARGVAEDGGNAADQQPADEKATRRRGVRQLETASDRHCRLPASYYSDMDWHQMRARRSGDRDAPAFGFSNFENSRQPHAHQYERAGAGGYWNRQFSNGFNYRPPHYFEPHGRRQLYVMRSRHTRPHYAPYAHHRAGQRTHHGDY